MCVFINSFCCYRSLVCVYYNYFIHKLSCPSILLPSILCALVLLYPPPPSSQRARIDVGRALAVRKQEQVAKSLAALLEKRAASLVGRDLRLRAELTDTATAASSALESGVNKWLRRGAGKRELAEHARKVLGNEDGPIDPRELNLAKQQV
jgi:hypothetical protein